MAGPISIINNMMNINDLKVQTEELNDQINDLTSKAARLERKNEALKSLLIKYVHLVHKDDPATLNETLLLIESM